jgi:hypothetical protein
MQRRLLSEPIVETGWGERATLDGASQWTFVELIQELNKTARLRIGLDEVAGNVQLKDLIEIRVRPEVTDPWS